MASCMTLDKNKNRGQVLICCSDNLTRDVILLSQEAAIIDSGILYQIGRKDRFWLSGTVCISGKKKGAADCRFRGEERGKENIKDQKTVKMQQRNMGSGI